MSSRIHVPEFSKKILHAAARLGLPQNWDPLCKEINIKRRTLVDAVNKTASSEADSPTPALLDQLAVALGFDWHWTEFYDRESRGRDTLAAFQEKLAKDGLRPSGSRGSSQISAELLRALRNPPDDSNLTTTRGVADAVNMQFASVMTFVDQSDIRRLSLEVTGNPWTLTIVDDAGRPFFQRKIVLLRGQIELNLGGAEVVGGLAALKQVINAYARTPEARGINLTMSGSATAPIIGFEVQRDFLGVLRPGFNPPPEPDAGDNEEHADNLLCVLNNLQDGTEVSVLLRAYHKDFYLLPGEASTPIGFAPPRPVLHADGPELTDKESQLIMARLWELSLEQTRGGRVPGEIVVAYDVRAYKERV